MNQLIKNTPELPEENWETLVELLPKNWQEEAQKTKAIRRTPRKFTSKRTKLRVLFMHIANGLSLRETSARSKLANIAHISDVGIYKSLKKSQDWLKRLCDLLAEEIGIFPINKTKGKRLRVIDGTYVSEQGRTGSDWLVHYSMDLGTLSCDHFAITQNKGKGNGETLTRFPIKKGDCILADRGYCSQKGITYVCEKGGDILVRLQQQKLSLKDLNNEKFDILAHVQTIKKTGSKGEWPVKILYKGKEINGRICALKKSKKSTDLCLKKQKSEAKKSQLSFEAKKLAEYVVVFTTLMDSEWSTQEILDLYRRRWQIELSFKRLKSLLQFGHLPKYNSESCKAWFYGKLLVAMLIEKSLRMAQFFSPWGY